MPNVAGFRSRLIGGWFRHDGQEPDYLQAMSDGFWTTVEPDFTISGDALGKGRVEGQSNMWWYIDDDQIDTAGKGLTSAEFYIEQTFDIQGSGLGKGKIDGLTFFSLPIRISGVAFGKGKINHRLNYSKTRALNPILKAQNAGYIRSDCPIAAIEYQGFSPNEIINQIDKSDDIFENTEAFYAVEELNYSGNTDSYPIRHYPYNDISSGLIDYLVTDISSENQNGRPLFYQYELLYDAKADSNETLISNLYKNNQTVISPSSYELQTSTDLISSNSRYSSTSWASITEPVGSTIKRVRLLLPIEFSDENTFYTVEYQKVANGVVSYQKELVELKPLYKKNKDYIITADGLKLTPSSSISDTENLILVKNPNFKIHPLGIAAMKDQDSFMSYVSDAASSWNLKLNIGSFLQPSSFYTVDSDNFYYLPNLGVSGNIPITNISPEIVGNNILKVDTFPIYIDDSSDGYSYPDYNINIYDKTEDTLNDSPGSIAIEVNGITRTDIKILSIDREKGFLYIDTDLFPSDEVELSYYIKETSSHIVENLELNPKINDGTTLYHISGYQNGIGIALRPYDGTVATSYPYIYDPSIDESLRIAKSIPPIGDTETIVNWRDHDFFTLCELTLNRLSKDMVRLTDARRVGGGLDMSLVQNWFDKNYGKSTKIHESEWYTNNGYYDGEPLAHNGAFLIHIPEANLNELRQRWINHYSKELSQEKAQKLGDKEFKFYLDQTIKRYISAGSDYILLPTLSGEVTDIFYLE